MDLCFLSAHLDLVLLSDILTFVVIIVQYVMLNYN